MWNPTLMHVQIFLGPQQFIYCMIDDWFLTVVYDSPHPSTRRLLWNRLSAIGLSISGPWLIVGDFNTVIHQSEKNGGAGVNHLSAFLQFISPIAWLTWASRVCPSCFGAVFFTRGLIEKLPMQIVSRAARLAWWSNFRGSALTTRCFSYRVAPVPSVRARR